MPESYFPTQELIKTRAYELYVKNGATLGRDIEHWLAAERELTELYVEELFIALKARRAAPDIPGHELHGVYREESTSVDGQTSSGTSRAKS
jgi:hypothetical protein